MKTCAKCGIEKPLADFYYHSGRTCKACRIAYVTERYRTNPEYRESHRQSARKREKTEKRKAYVTQWNRDNASRISESARGRRLVDRYGITAEDYDAMHEAQSGKCKVCGTTEPGWGANRLVVDHDHETGRVRGLLCSGCNVALGLVNEDAQRLRLLIGYLE